MFQYSTVSQTINECSRDIDYYLLIYAVSDSCNDKFTALCSHHAISQTLGIMHLENSSQHIEAKLEMFLPLASTSQLRTGAMTGITLIDATGRKHDVSIGFAKSYEVCV